MVSISVTIRPCFEDETHIVEIAIAVLEVYGDGWESDKLSTRDTAPAERRSIAVTM